jgi:hypothetical protein
MPTGYNPSDFDPKLKVFSPVYFSDAENRFLLDHLGEPAILAVRDIKGVENTEARYRLPGQRRDKDAMVFPDGVVPASVRPVLEGVMELEELQKFKVLKWVGIAAIKKSIEIWFREKTKWKNQHKRNPNFPRWPSLYSWDAKGQPHRGGPGSDSGDVKTWFDEKGNRQPFAVNLIVIEDEIEPFVAPTRDETAADERWFEDPVTNRFECRVKDAEGHICGHTESYKDGSRQSRSIARTRMGRHLKNAKNEAEQHREVYTMEFGAR